MAISREEYLSKFKKLSSMNESVIKQVQEMDMKDEDEVPYTSGVVSTGGVQSTDEADAPKPEGDAGATPDASAPAGDQAGSDAGAAGLGADPLATAPTPPQQTQDAGGMGDTSVTPPENEMPQDTGIGGVDTVIGGGMEGGMDMQPSQDDIQNELLKLQVSALQKLSSKFDDIELQINDLNNKLEKYSIEVEKVKEPNPVEKIENRWEDSYPFKYRLNDLWNGNVFQAGHDLFPKQAEPIKQTDDGGYIASYGDISNTMSDFDLRKSFNEGVQKLQKKINEQTRK